MYIRNPETNEWEEVFLPPTGDTYPIGMYGWFAGEKAPTNWLRCDGQAVSRTEYKELFNAIGTTYGVGDGSTTFNLPNVNLENRTLVGSSGDGEFSVGNTGGEKEHALTISEMPAHSHGISCGWTSGENAKLFYNSNNGSNSMETGSRGGGQPHNNMQPYIASVCCIKAKQSAGIVGDITNNINDLNENAVPNAKTVKDYVDGIILYNDESGSNEIVTLNDSVVNYEYIEIFAKVGAITSSVKIFEPNNKRFSLVIKTSETTLLQIDADVYLVSGNKITLVQGQRINLGINYLAPWDASNIYITRVVGYGKID